MVPPRLVASMISAKDDRKGPGPLSPVTHSVPDRIVSIVKSYICPIDCGKVVKKVELEAKLNMIMVDGINFIEHFSFDAFTEGPNCSNEDWTG